MKDDKITHNKPINKRIFIFLIIFNISCSGSDEAILTIEDITTTSLQEITTTTDQDTTTTSFPLRDVSNPPWDGTIFITGNIITSEDPSTYESQEYKGIDSRLMYDRREKDFINIDAHLFDTYYSDLHYIEVQVNPEFPLEEAKVEANKYAWLIGQLPKVLKRDIQTVWIHKGNNDWGGGNNNILIHTGRTQEYVNWVTGNIVEETLIHEAVHTSVDSYYYGTEKWNEQVQKDEYRYVSTYAKNYPDREDIAEMFPLYIAVTFFPERITIDIKNKFLETSSNRVKFFNEEDLDFSLYEKTE